MQPFLFVRPGGDTVPIDRPDSRIANAQYNAWLRGQGLRGMGADVTSQLNVAAAALVKGATFESQVSPTMHWSPKFGATTEGPGIVDWFVRNVAKPKFTIQTVAGSATIAPYGEPKPGAYLTAALTVGALATGGALYLMWKGIRG